jgi:hypothetical protein
LKEYLIPQHHHNRCGQKTDCQPKDNTSEKSLEVKQLITIFPVHIFGTWNTDLGAITKPDLVYHHQIKHIQQKEQTKCMNKGTGKATPT